MGERRRRRAGASRGSCRGSAAKPVRCGRPPVGAPDLLGSAGGPAMGLQPARDRGAGDHAHPGLRRRSRILAGAIRRPSRGRRSRRVRWRVPGAILRTIGRSITAEPGRDRRAVRPAWSRHGPAGTRAHAWDRRTGPPRQIQEGPQEARRPEAPNHTAAWADPPGSDAAPRRAASPPLVRPAGDRARWDRGGSRWGRPVARWWDQPRAATGGHPDPRRDGRRRSLARGGVTTGDGGPATSDRGRVAGRGVTRTNRRKHGSTDVGGQSERDRPKSRANGRRDAAAGHWPGLDGHDGRSDVYEARLRVVPGCGTDGSAADLWRWLADVHRARGRLGHGRQPAGPGHLALRAGAQRIHRSERPDARERREPDRDRSTSSSSCPTRRGH